jgi:Zn-dependent protease
MFTSFRLGSVFGFPIRVNLSFLLFLLIALLSMGGGLPALGVALMVAGSVLLHELGHALMARHLGVPIRGIELHFFGGAAQMADTPRTPADEIAIAAAGPAVSLALAALGYGLAGVTGIGVLVTFSVVNLALGVFNLLPAFPSDGGRILRAWLARRRGLVRATDIAVKVGRILCAAMVVTGIAIGSLQLMLVAAVLWVMGGAERLSARLRGDSGGWQGEDARAIPEVEYVPPGTRADRAPGSPFPPRGRPVVVLWRL